MNDTRGERLRSGPGPRAQRGNALLAAILFNTVLLSLTAAMLLVSTAESRAVFDRGSHQTAFFLAESGIEASTYEISQSVDPDGDGIGNRVRAAVGGSYFATAVEELDGTWTITSVGSAGSADVQLRAVIGFDKTTTFPISAMAIVGDFDKYKLKIKKHADLLIDGGNTSALALSNKQLYDKTLKEVLKAIENGRISEDSFLGHPPTTIFDGSKKDDPVQVDLPIHHQPDYSDSLQDLGEVYNQIVARVNEILPTAVELPPDGGKVKGKNSYSSLEGQPQNADSVYTLSRWRLQEGDVVSGQGTLIINDEIRLDHGAILNWDGNVIIMADDKKKAELDVHSGTVNVTGNIIVLGEGREKAELKIKHDSSVSVEGSLLVGTAFEGHKGKKAKVSVDDDGKLSVDGVFTVTGSKAHLNFKHESQLSVEGMLQILAVEGAGHEDLKLHFDGDATIRKNDKRIQDGVGALLDLGLDLNVPEIEEKMVTESVSVRAWHEI